MHFSPDDEAIDVIFTMLKDKELFAQTALKCGISVSGKWRGKDTSLKIDYPTYVLAPLTGDDLYPIYCRMLLKNSMKGGGDSAEEERAAAATSRLTAHTVGIATAHAAARFLLQLREHIANECYTGNKKEISLYEGNNEAGDSDEEQVVIKNLAGSNNKRRRDYNVLNDHLDTSADKLRRLCAHTV